MKSNWQDTIWRLTPASCICATAAMWAKPFEEYGLTPVVLTRNIFDIVASFRDHLRNESTDAPSVFLGPEHAMLPDRAVEELIAELAIPWFINFYVSWQRADCLRVDYNSFLAAPASAVSLICERAHMNADGRSIENAIEKARTKAHRFNKGVSGRDADISPKARETIVSFARHYPDVDFGPIGILRAGAAMERASYSSSQTRTRYGPLQSK